MITTETEEKLHPRSKHNGGYDFKLLIKVYPPLEEFLISNKQHKTSIDFFNPAAVQTLNSALLKAHYGISDWNMPSGYLCPPVPGRADYIHNIADLLATDYDGKIPMGDDITCMDIGMGANCIYPILGAAIYEWKFIGTEVDEYALKSAQNIVNKNASLKNKIELRLQKNPIDTIHRILNENEKIDAIVCNPPFFASPEEAHNEALIKLTKLRRGDEPTQLVRNFGGKSKELWCDGGEKKFIKGMIRQSKWYGHQCLWFSSLVSKKTNLSYIYGLLQKAEIKDLKTMEMGQGNKKSRIVAWTFMDETERKEWIAQKKKK